MSDSTKPLNDHCEASTPTLNYAPGAGRFKRRLLKRIVLIALMLGIGFEAWRDGPHAYAFAKLRYWQRQCMNFAPPPWSGAASGLVVSQGRNEAAHRMRQL